MNLTSRPITQEDVSTLSEWWKDWGFENPPIDFLPDIGLIVSSDGVDVCAAFMYITNSKVAWISWIISDKNYRIKPNRRDALSFLIDDISREAKAQGYEYCYINFDNNHLIPICEDLGFYKGSKTQEMIKKWD